MRDLSIKVIPSLKLEVARSLSLFYPYLFYLSLNLNNLLLIPSVIRISPTSNILTRDLNTSSLIS